MSDMQDKEILLDQSLTHKMIVDTDTASDDAVALMMKRSDSRSTM